LILRKIVEIVATKCQILRLKCTKFNFGCRPRWGSLQRSPDPLAGYKGPTSKGREGREGKGGEGEGRRGDVEGPGKWYAPGSALALGGPVNTHNKKCGRRVQLTQYASPASNDTGTAFCFPKRQR